MVNEKECTQHNGIAEMWMEESTPVDDTAALPTDSSARCVGGGAHAAESVTEWMATAISSSNNIIDLDDCTNDEDASARFARSFIEKSVNDNSDDATTATAVAGADGATPACILRHKAHDHGVISELRAALARNISKLVRMYNKRLRCLAPFAPSARRGRCGDGKEGNLLSQEIIEINFDDTSTRNNHSDTSVSLPSSYTHAHKIVKKDAGSSGNVYRTAAMVGRQRNNCNDRTGHLHEPPDPIWPAAIHRVWLTSGVSLRSSNDERRVVRASEQNDCSVEGLKSAHVSTYRSDSNRRTEYLLREHTSPVSATGVLTSILPCRGSIHDKAEREKEGDARSDDDSAWLNRLGLHALSSTPACSGSALATTYRTSDYTDTIECTDYNTENNFGHCESTVSNDPHGCRGIVDDGDTPGNIMCLEKVKPRVRGGKSDRRDTVCVSSKSEDGNLETNSALSVYALCADTAHHTQRGSGNMNSRDRCGYADSPTATIRETSIGTNSALRNEVVDVDTLDTSTSLSMGYNSDQSRADNHYESTGFPMVSQTPFMSSALLVDREVEDDVTQSAAVAEFTCCEHKSSINELNEHVVRDEPANKSKAMYHSDTASLLPFSVDTTKSSFMPDLSWTGEVRRIGSARSAEPMMGFAESICETTSVAPPMCSRAAPKEVNIDSCENNKRVHVDIGPDDEVNTVPRSLAANFLERTTTELERLCARWGLRCGLSSRENSECPVPQDEMTCLMYDPALIPLTPHVFKDNKNLSGKTARRCDNDGCGRAADEYVYGATDTNCNISSTNNNASSITSTRCNNSNQECAVEDFISSRICDSETYTLLYREYMCAQLRLYAVRERFQHCVASRALHRVKGFSGLKYKRIRASELTKSLRCRRRQYTRHVYCCDHYPCNTHEVSKCRNKNVCTNDLGRCPDQLSCTHGADRHTLLRRHARAVEQTETDRCIVSALCAADVYDIERYSATSYYLNDTKTRPGELKFDCFIHGCCFHNDNNIDDRHNDRYDHDINIRNKHKNIRPYKLDFNAPCTLSSGGDGVSSSYSPVTTKNVCPILDGADITTANSIVKCDCCDTSVSASLLSVYAQLLLLEPVDLSHITSVVRQHFPHVPNHSVTRLLARSDVNYVTASSPSRVCPSIHQLRAMKNNFQT